MGAKPSIHRSRMLQQIWALPAALLIVGLVYFQLSPGHSRGARANGGSWKVQPRSDLSVLAPHNMGSLRSTFTCHEEADGRPEQRVCVFENLVVHGGRVLFVSEDPHPQIPPIQYAWLRKFEGEDFFSVKHVAPNHLPFTWTGALVEDVPHAGLFHQQHYSNFYHMFSEMAPTFHHVLCKYLGDCTYDPDSKLRLLFVQEKRADQPPYILLDSIADTLRCLSPHPAYHIKDAEVRDRVLVLRRAVAGVGPDVRVFHNWEEDLKKHWREPPRASMEAYRARVSACFGMDLAAKRAETGPAKILFINRHYEEGRSILNAARLSSQIMALPEVKAFPGGVELVEHHLEAQEGLRAQAELFWNASLLIWPHGATMAHTFFLPRGAQAVEVIPWCQEDKANLPEWVEAIRDAFGLRVKLYRVQNRERARQMFNQDLMLQYHEYRVLSPDQKVALLERGECPQGVDGFLCPFWWNHWKVSVNLDWEELRPAVQEGLRRLAEGWDEQTPEPPRKALEKEAEKKEEVVAEAAQDSKKEERRLEEESAESSSQSSSQSSAESSSQSSSQSSAESSSQSSSQSPAATSTRSLARSPGDAAATEGWAAVASHAPVIDAATGRPSVPLSSYKCLHDDGSAERRICVFADLWAHQGAVWYVVEDGAGEAARKLPDIEIAWEDWTLQAGLREDKYFAPRVATRSEMDDVVFKEEATSSGFPQGVEVVRKAALIHQVDSGNFYHLIAEVQPTLFSNWCVFLSACSHGSPNLPEIFFIHPAPRRDFGLPRAAEEGFRCLSAAPLRDVRDPAQRPRLVRLERAVAGVGPHMRAYEQQGFRAGREDPPKGVMPKWRALLSDCTGTGFAERGIDEREINLVFVNRPYSSGRAFLNLYEVQSWLDKEFVPNLGLKKPVKMHTVYLESDQSLKQQIEQISRASVLVYPHGATMSQAPFLPARSAVLEVIPWPNVTEPHGWLESIARQYELGAQDIRVDLLVNDKRANLVLNWHALARDPAWASLSAEEKVALQERGTCPKAHEPRCFFEWLHWRSELVLDPQALGKSLKPLLERADALSSKVDSA